MTFKSFSFLKFGMVLVLLLILLFYLFGNAVPVIQPGVTLNPEEARDFLLTNVPLTSTGFFDPTGFILNSELFPDRLKAASVLLGDNFVILGIKTLDGSYLAVRLLEFDFHLYETFIIPFENNFSLSGIPELVHPGHSYEYARYAIIDPVTKNYACYHSIAILAPNPDYLLDSNLAPTSIKAIFFFKYI